MRSMFLIICRVKLWQQVKWSYLQDQIWLWDGLPGIVSGSVGLALVTQKVSWFPVSPESHLGISWIHVFWCTHSVWIPVDFNELFILNFSYVGTVRVTILHLSFRKQPQDRAKILTTVWLHCSDWTLNALEILLAHLQGTYDYQESSGSLKQSS